MNISEELYSTLEDMAGDYGLYLSNYLRYLLLKHVVSDQAERYFQEVHDRAVESASAATERETDIPIPRPAHLLPEVAAENLPF